MRRANPFLPIDDNLPDPIDEGTPGPSAPPSNPLPPGSPTSNPGQPVNPGTPNVGPVVNNLPNPATADSFVLPTQRTFGGNKQASGGWGDPTVGTGWTNISNFLSKGNINYGRSLQGQPGPMDTSKGRSQRAGEMDDWLWNIGGRTPGSEDIPLNDVDPNKPIQTLPPDMSEVMKGVATGIGNAWSNWNKKFGGGASQPKPTEWKYNPENPLGTQKPEPKYEWKYDPKNPLHINRP